MTDGFHTEETKGFYTYHAKPIHNININRDGGILWWFYKNGQLTAIADTNFSGSFVKVTVEEGDKYGDFNCALWLDHGGEYYVFGYFLRGISKPSRLAKWHQQLMKIEPGATVDLWVAPGKVKTHVNMGVTVNGEKLAFDE